MPGHVCWFHLVYGLSKASVTLDDRMFYNTALKGLHRPLTPVPNWDTFFILQGLIQVPLKLHQHIYQHCTPILRLRQGFLPQNIYCNNNHTVYFLLVLAFQVCPALRFAPRCAR